MDDPTLAEAVAQVIELVQALTFFQAELADWAAGTANGGPDGDGRYPFTQPDGTVFLLPSIARIVADLGGGSAPGSFDPGDSGLVSTTQADAIRELAERLLITLAPLGLGGGTFRSDVSAGAVIGQLVGKTAGSKVAINPPDSRVLLTGSDAAGYSFVRGAGAVAVGDFAVSVTEVDARAKNSPRSTQLTIRVITPPAFASIVGFGDSITANVGASPASQSWFNLYAAHFGLSGANALNQGIGGTVLQNSPDAGGGPKANNGRDRFVTALTGANKRDRVLVGYGFNDARYVAAPATFGVGQYELDLNETIRGLIALGYAPGQIVVISPYYISDTGLQTSTSPGFAGQSRAGFEAYVAASRRVALAWGTLYADTYADMLANGGDRLIGPDYIHPNNTGHAAIFASVLAAATINLRPAVTGVTVNSTGTGALSTSWTKPAGAQPSSYTVAYFAEDWIYAGQQTIAADTVAATWTGIAGGKLRSQVRANYADGSAGPWVVSSNSVTLAAAGAPFVADSFTDAPGTSLLDHEGEIGASYATAPGFGPSSHPIISGGELYNTNQLDVYYASGVPNKADMDVSVRLICRSVLANEAIGVLARQSTSANTAYFADWRPASNGYRLNKVVGGTSTTLGTFGATMAPGDQHTLVLSVRDQVQPVTVGGQVVSANVWVSLDGVPIIAVEDHSITGAGRAGLRLSTPGGQTATTGVHVDDFAAATV